MDFLIAGVAATCAGFFSNPFDVIKTRQQLQGELEKPVSGSKKYYTTQWAAIRTIVRNEGIFGLQKGLVPALSFQFVMNSTRLGLYKYCENNNFTRFKGQKDNSVVLCVFFGGVCGVAGSTIGCPLYMIKTQLQSQSHGKYAVGYQHNHNGMFDAFVTIYKTRGFRGLWHGYGGIVPRTAVGSAIQISTFTLSKDMLRKYDSLGEKPILITLLSSMISGVFLSIGMTPFDVVATRLFNQGVDKNGKGLLYNNIIDCFVKTFKIEGMRGLYKGFVANYLRCAPHTVLNLTFWDILIKWHTIYLSDESMYFE